jgi:hypothetical protein
MIMRSTVRRLAGATLAGILVVACGAAATPTPAPTPAPTPVPVAAATPPATATPTATPVPQTDGEGAEHVVGTAAANLQKPYTETKVGDVTQVRDGVAVLTFAMNDPRVTGMATWDFDIDVYGPYGPEGLGPEWGPFRIESDDGSWEGPCSGGAWHEGDGIVMSCWLVGVGAYEGSTFYLALEKAVGASSAEVEGIIYPGSPPAP